MILRIFRANLWWSTIVPQVLGWVYFCILADVYNTSAIVYPLEYIFKVLQFFVSLVSFSAFGYTLNDWCDIDTDALAGKQNLFSKLSPIVRPLIVFSLLTLGLATWNPPSHISSALLVAQIFSLVVYSVTRFRLKNRKWVGVAVDAFYGHINPVLITLAYFGFFESLDSSLKLFLIFILISAITLKGIRNIILHQIEDRKKDKLAGIKTFVVTYGSFFSFRLVNNFLVFEILFTALLPVVISTKYPPFLIGALLFAVLTYLKFSGWKLAYLPKRQLQFKFLHFLNDYYESWFPLFLLIILCVKQPTFMPVLILHLMVFPRFVVQLWKDFVIIKENFKSEEDY